MLDKEKNTNTIYWGGLNGVLPLGAISLPFVALLTLSSVCRVVHAFMYGGVTALFSLALLVATLLSFYSARTTIKVPRSDNIDILFVVISTILENASLGLSIEEFLPCSSRLTWCGPPDHLTSSLLLSLLSQSFYFMCILDRNGRYNNKSTVVIAVVWLMNLCITLNIYNGDAVSLLFATQFQENYEYALGHFAVIAVGLITRDDDVALWLTATIAILVNLYWVGAYPFGDDNDIRHRTEYYDTQNYIANAYNYIVMTRIYLWQNSKSSNVMPRNEQLAESL